MIEYLKIIGDKGDFYLISFIYLYVLIRNYSGKLKIKT